MLDPATWARRLQNVEADIVCVGHSHMQFNLAVDGVVVVNPGSVGQPRDGDPRAAYAVIDDNKIELKRVAYPIEETIARIEASALPDRAKQIMIDCLRLGRLPESVAERRGGGSEPWPAGRPGAPGPLRLALRGAGGGGRLLLQLQPDLHGHARRRAARSPRACRAWRSCRSSSSSWPARSPIASTCSAWATASRTSSSAWPCRRSGCSACRWSIPAPSARPLHGDGRARRRRAGALRHLLRRHGHRRDAARRPRPRAGDARRVAAIAAMVCSYGFGLWLERGGHGPGRYHGLLWACAGAGPGPAGPGAAPARAPIRGRRACRAVRLGGPAVLAATAHVRLARRSGRSTRSSATASRST